MAMIMTNASSAVDPSGEESAKPLAVSYLQTTLFSCPVKYVATAEYADAKFPITTVEPGYTPAAQTRRMG